MSHGTQSPTLQQEDQISAQAGATTIRHSTSTEPWTLFGRKTQRSKVEFLSQVIILYLIILCCLTNITLESKNFNLWSTLLASSIGYLLPSPRLKTRKGDEQ